MNVLVSCFKYTLGLNWSYNLVESPTNRKFSNNSRAVTLCKSDTSDSLEQAWSTLDQEISRPYHRYLSANVKEVKRYYVFLPNGLELSGNIFEDIPKLQCLSYDQLDPKELHYCGYPGELSDLFTTYSNTALNKSIVFEFQDVTNKKDNSITGTSGPEELVTNIVRSPTSEGLSERLIQLAIQTEKEIEKTDELHMCCFEYHKLKALEVEYNNFRQYNLNLENAYEYEYKRADNLVVMNIMLEKQIKEKEATIKDITARNEELNKETNHNILEIEHLKHSLINLEQSMELETNTRHELQQEVKCLKEHNDNLKNTNKQLLEREIQLEVSNTGHETKMSEAVASHSQAINRMKEELMRYKEEISKKNLHSRHLERLLGLERNSRNSMEIHFKDLQKYIKNLENKHEDITEQAKNMKLLNNELKKQISEKEHICKVKDEELTQCKNDLTKYNDLLETVENLLYLETIKRISAETALIRFKEGVDSLNRKYQDKADEKEKQIKLLRHEFKDQLKKRDAVFQVKHEQREMLLTGTKVMPNINNRCYKPNVRKGYKLKTKSSTTQTI